MRDSAMARGARIILRAAAPAALMLTYGCAAMRAHNENREVMDEVYSGQVELYGAMEQTLNELGREYFLLGQEYRAVGRKDMAEMAEKRARMLHKQYRATLAHKSDYERRLNALRRHDDAVTGEIGREDAPEEAPVAVPPLPQADPAASAEASAK